jgi:hypothetical protein
LAKPLRAPSQEQLKMAIQEDPQLRYLEAAKVEHPTGTLEGYEICTDAQERLGSIDGVLLMPLQRRVRYFVIESPGWTRRKYLVSASPSTRIDTEDGRIYVGAQRYVRPYDPESVPPFSDDDLIETMFSSQVA